MACAHAPAQAPVSAEELRALRDEVRALRAERDLDKRKIRALEALVATVPVASPEQVVAQDAKLSTLPQLETIRLVPPSPVASDEDEEDDSYVFIADGGSGPSSPRTTARAVPGRRTGGPDAAPALPVNVELADPDRPDRSFFDEGIAALEAGEASLAIELLEAFIRSAPRDPRADNAVLAIGDAWLVLERPGNALQSFERVVREYPAGDVVPEALLRYGETCRNLGRESAARAAFERLVRDHPASIAATRAELHLAAR